MRTTSGSHMATRTTDVVYRTMLRDTAPHASADFSPRSHSPEPGAVSETMSSIRTICPPAPQFPSISRNLLASRFEALIADGIVERRAYQQRPLRYEYHLTTAGSEPVPVLMTLMAWGDRWVTPPGGPPVRLVHDSCGHDWTPQVSCAGAENRSPPQP